MGRCAVVGRAHVLLRLFRNPLDEQGSLPARAIAKYTKRMLDASSMLTVAGGQGATNHDPQRMGLAFRSGDRSRGRHIHWLAGPQLETPVDRAFREEGLHGRKRGIAPDRWRRNDLQTHRRYNLPRHRDDVL